MNLRPILAAYFIALCLSCAIGILTFRSWFDPRPADSAMACCALPIILPLLASGGPLTFVLGPIAFLAAPVWLICVCAIRSLQEMGLRKHFAIGFVWGCSGFLLMFFFRSAVVSLRSGLLWRAVDRLGAHPHLLYAILAAPIAVILVVYVWRRGRGGPRRRNADDALDNAEGDWVQIASKEKAATFAKAQEPPACLSTVDEQRIERHVPKTDTDDAVEKRPGKHHG